jgi:phenylpropionate dioxygenase-like ring-hydroxylating dioxygenase large terminal subunit
MREPWLAASPAEQITTRPRGVVVSGVALVLYRPAPDQPALAFIDRCPHRLVPLSAGVLADGRLRCAYHGWEFDLYGRCAVLPSARPQAAPPPRANLPPSPRLRESDGVIAVHADDLAALAEVARVGAELGNEDTALARAWHPVALAEEVGENGLTVALLGRMWTVWSRNDTFAADPRPFGVTQRWGAVWLAPLEPLVDLFDEPDAEDTSFARAWLPPVRTPASAGVVADNFLDVAHFPFVHAGTFGAQAERMVEPSEVTPNAHGFTSVQLQWFDNPEDPGVAQGIRPSRQRRRATYVYRAPFQLLLRLEELDAGAVKTILFFAQPESSASTRIYTKMLLRGIGGVAVADPATVAREVAFEEAVLAEDLALQSRMRQIGLPLRMGDELHVRADQLGIALRRQLRAFLKQAEDR